MALHFGCFPEQVFVPVGIVAELYVPLRDGRMKLLCNEKLEGSSCDVGVDFSFEESSQSFRFLVPSGAHTLVAERSWPAPMGQLGKFIV